ncbi:hypothetical protein [Caballeronia sp. LZ035]|uniref:hypothetical protein n=1 Tax=Caballeronia sp. LZ035 TaxID=3038568 RepID=UPI0028623A2A|nr:hypothetical protein [Caballeronia sp. LZ035]MDR5760477.1 hypothetical protein [Caballeronia sp. LZ035]
MVSFSGTFSDVPNLTPGQAWAYVARVAAQPSIVFSGDRIEDASTCWWTIVESFLSTSDAESSIRCLISIGELGALPWALIDIPLGTSVLETLAINEGCPEFIITNTSGNVFLAVSSEEDEIWIYLVENNDSSLTTRVLNST